MKRSVTFNSPGSFVAKQSVKQIEGKNKKELLVAETKK